MQKPLLVVPDVNLLGHVVRFYWTTHVWREKNLQGIKLKNNKSAGTKIIFKWNWFYMFMHGFKLQFADIKGFEISGKAYITATILTARHIFPYFYRN